MQTRQSPISSGSARPRPRGRTGARPSPAPARAGTAEQVLGGALVELVLRDETPASPLVVEAEEFTGCAPYRRPELVGAADAFPLPEGDEPGAPGAGETSTRSRVISSMRHVEAPRRKGLAGAGLVHHLLVELADPAAAVDEVDAEQPAVGDRAGVRHRRRAPSRPRRTPATRSHVIRGRSSANSSDG